MAKSRYYDFNTTPEGLSSVTSLRLAPLGHRGSRLVYKARGLENVVDLKTQLKMFSIDSVFKDTNSVLLGCGTPNFAITLYDDKSHTWKRMNAFMFKRKESFVGETKGDLQVGVYYELRGLPPETKKKLLDAMRANSDKKTWSCARLNAKVLKEAGFTFGNGSTLAHILRPSKLGADVWEHGLKLDGKDVDLRVVNTSKYAIGDHFKFGWEKEVNSPTRTVQKQYQNHHEKIPRPAVPSQGVTKRTEGWFGPPVEVAINRPRWAGVWLGFLWGRHPEFRVRIPGFGGLPELGEPLTPFAGELNLASKFKKNVLFRPIVIKAINAIKIRGFDHYRNVPLDAAFEMLSPAPAENEQELADKSRANIWNVVIVDSGDGYEIRMTPLKNREELSQKSQKRKIVDWIMAKHVVLTSYDKRTVLANEAWCATDSKGNTVLCLNPDSGTYQPKIERVEAVAKWFRQNGMEVRVFAHEAEPDSPRPKQNHAVDQGDLSLGRRTQELSPDVRVVRPSKEVSTGVELTNGERGRGPALDSL